MFLWAYYLRMSSRIAIAGKQLAIVIRGWLRSTPDRLWGTDPNYEQLKALKRHDPMLAPDPRRVIADYIASRLDELEWEVTYPEPEPQKSPPSYRGAEQH
jgi:hypothetical protein